MNDDNGVTWSTWLGRGLPPQRMDDDLTERIDAVAERVDRLIAHLTTRPEETHR